VVKLLEGSRRKDVVLAETGEEAESIIRTFKSQHPNFLVQEYIKEAHGRDLRCFVIGNRVVAAIQREATPGGFRANKPQGGKVSKVKLSPAERSMAVKAAKILGLGIAGVDIVRSNSGPLLLDVNSSPGLKSIEHVTRKDIAGKIIASVEKKLGWSQVVETGNG
jgi:ribosomal protein S6--L-glutamate ligase